MSPIIDPKRIHPALDMRLCTCETAYVIHFPASHRARASASRASLGRENCAPMCAGLVHICPGDKAAHMSVHILDTERGRDKDMYTIGTFGRYAAGAAGFMQQGNLQLCAWRARLAIPPGGRPGLPEGYIGLGCRYGRLWLPVNEWNISNRYVI